MTFTWYANAYLMAELPFVGHLGMDVWPLFDLLMAFQSNYFSVATPFRRQNPGFQCWIMGNGNTVHLLSNWKKIILMPMRYFTFIYRRFETLPIAIRAAWWMCLSAFAYAASIAIVHHLTHRLPVFEIALGRNVFALVFMPVSYTHLTLPTKA